MNSNKLKNTATFRLSLDTVDEVQKVLDDTFLRRRNIIAVGFAIYLIASISSMIAVIIHSFRYFI